MATNKNKMTDEEWLKQRGEDGAGTFVNPNGGRGNAYAGTPYESGQTYAMGTWHPDEYGGTAYDGAQNYLGRWNGDGTLTPNGEANRAALEAAYNQYIAGGGTLNGKTAADYDAWAEGQHEAMRQSYLDQRNQYGGAANVPGSAAYLWANSASNPGYNPGGSGFDINRIYDAQQAAALAALERSYNASLAGYNGAKDNINAQYYEEARKAQAQSDLERQRMNQMFNANGLANGGIGQASLAQNNALLGNLNALSTANAADLSTVDTALAKLQADYQGAVAEAIANNELERAQALYQQWQDEQARALQAEQTAYDRQMDAYNMMLKEQQYRDSQTAANQKLMQSQVEDMLAMKGVTSIPDYMIEASGYDPAYINAVLAQKAQEEAAAAAAASRSYSGSGGGGGEDDTVGGGTLLDRMLAAGSEAAALELLLREGAKWTSAERGEYMTMYRDALKEQEKAAATDFNATWDRVRGLLRQGNTVAAQSYLSTVWGSLSDTQKEQMRRWIGNEGYDLNL